MPLTIPNTTVDSDTYVDRLSFSGSDVFASGYITVANNPIFIALLQGIRGQATDAPEQYLPPATYSLQSNAQRPVAGLRVRRAVSTATPNPQFFGSLYYPAESVLQAGNPFSQIVSPGGQVTGTLLSYVELTGTVALAGTTEATATAFLTCASLTFDGATTIEVEVYVPYILRDATGGDTTCNIYLYDNGASIGNLHRRDSSAVSQVPAGGIFVKRRFTPSAGAHIISIRGAASVANGYTITGGAGGLGNFLPAYVKVQIP